MNTSNSTILFLSALFAMLFYAPGALAQIPDSTIDDYSDCLHYNSFDISTDNWLRRTDKDGDYRVNTGDNAASITSGNQGFTGASGDEALRAYDRSGSDVIFNQSITTGDDGYIGNCFCFDFRVIDDRGADVKPSIGFYLGDLTDESNPYSDPEDPDNVITSLAIFQWDQVVKAEDGWIRLCAPIELSSNEDGSPELPSNDEGSWRFPESFDLGAGITVNYDDFDQIMTNPDGIMFYIDYIDDPNEKYLIDNVCLGDCSDEPTNGDGDGAFCGDPESNLLENANFESGDTGFDSDYDSNPMTLPGQYTVSNSADAFGMDVQDHSNCVDADMYPDNDSFLLVNGLTNQSDGSSSIVYSQDVELEADKEYKLCVNLKDLPNCNFNIHPEIQIEIGDQIVVPYFEIISDPTDPCDWMFVSECFIAEDDGPLKIRLNEDVLGDGNDFAMDDISLTEMESLNIDLSVTHTADNDVNATIDPETLPNEECEELGDEDHYWFVFQTDNPMNPTASVNDFAWSDGSGSYGAGVDGNVWSLPTTNFPDYNFENNNFYVVGMYVPGCCDGGFTDGWAYQITFKSTSGRTTTPMPNAELSEEAKEEIISRFVKMKDKVSILNGSSNQTMKVYPNPSQGNFKVNMDEMDINSGKIEVFDLNGRSIYQGDYKNFNQEEIQLDLSPERSGMYILKLTGDNNKTITKEILIQK